MAEIKFKSVGELSSAEKFTKKVVNEKPLGFKTPMRFGSNNDGIFSMHFKRRNQVRDNLKNLLLTNHGERLCHSDFGANLRSLVFEMTTDVEKESFDNKAISLIARSVSKYMQFINLKTFESKPVYDQSQNTAKIKIKVIYDVPALDIEDDAVELSLFVGG